MTNDCAPFFPVSFHAFEAGFRLPLSEVGAQLCCRMGVAPGQLHPNVWRCITAYMDRCQELDRAASLEDFVLLHSVVKVPSEHGLYSLKSEVKSKWKHPDCIADWRRKWLLVRPPVGLPFPVSFSIA